MTTTNNYGAEVTRAKVAEVRKYISEKGYLNYWEFPGYISVITGKKGALARICLGTVSGAWGWDDDEGFGLGGTIGDPETAREVVGILFAQIADIELNTK